MLANGCRTLVFVRACGHVVIVDDDAPFQALLRSILDRAGFTSSAVVRGLEAIETVREEQPDVVVLDMCLPDVNGLEVCRELREEFGEELPIMFVSGDRVESFDRVAGLLMGADDYLPKPFDPDELVARVRRLARSRSWPGSRVGSDDFGLTPRELEVLALLAKGDRAAEIASQLTISEKTVATHLQHVLGKLGVHSRAEAVACAYRERLIEMPRVGRPSSYSSPIDSGNGLSPSLQ